MRRTLCAGLFGLALTSCASSSPAPSAGVEVQNSTRCWVGQLTKIDESGYRVSSVPMLLRIERQPDARRMVREVALGNPATVHRDVFYVKDDGAISFVETDLRARGYEASGQVEGGTWSSDAMSLELLLPDRSVRVREWEKGDILYGHYRYRDATGEYGDERFHALSPLERSACAAQMERAREGVLQPSPVAPQWAQSPAVEPASVKLRYDWPANLDATIRARILRDGTGLGAPEAVDVAYQLRTTPNDDGSRIEVRSRELLAVPTHTLEDEDRWERAKVLVSLFPAVLIDHQGQVAGLAEPEDYLETVRTAFLERWAGGKSAADEEALAYLDANLSPALAILSAQRFWNPIVAFWAGAELVVGKRETAHLTRALQFPGAVKTVEVRVPVVYGLDGWVRCRPDEAEARCVKLVSSYEISEFDVRQPLSNAGPEGRPVRVEKHLDRTQTVLIADPETLLPYHYYEERIVDSASGGATDRLVVQRREAMELTFSY